MKDTATNYEEETHVLEAIEAMKSEAGPAFSFAAINLAELERRTGVSRSKLRRLKRNGFEFKPHGNKGRTAQKTVLTGYTKRWMLCFAAVLRILPFAWSDCERQGTAAACPR